MRERSCPYYRTLCVIVLGLVDSRVDRKRLDTATADLFPCRSAPQVVLGGRAIAADGPAEPVRAGPPARGRAGRPVVRPRGPRAGADRRGPSAGAARGGDAGGGRTCARGCARGAGDAR